MLSAETLAGLRSVVATALPDTAAIERLTQVVDANGSTTDTYATASTVACRVSRIGTDVEERVLANRITGRSAFTVYLPYDADARETDRLAVTSADSAFAAQTYEVVGVLAPTTWGVHVRCVCARER